jgi:hypothetical protein
MPKRQQVAALAFDMVFSSNIVMLSHYQHKDIKTQLFNDLPAKAGRLFNGINAAI